jgi:hypothetical protein
MFTAMKQKQTEKAITIWARIVRGPNLMWAIMTQLDRAPRHRPVGLGYTIRSRILAETMSMSQTVPAMRRTRVPTSPHSPRSTRGFKI